MAIYWIEGQFWSWKTSLAVHLAHKLAKQTAKAIMKKVSSNQSIIITNIKLDQVEFPNYFYFEDAKILEMLRTGNAINDIEREIYWIKKNKWGLTLWPRKKFLKMYVFFDESWALMNSQKRLKDNETFAQYLNQCRKNFTDIFIISVEGNENNKILRSKVDWWYYVNTINFPILRDFWIIRACQKDKDDNIKTIKYLGKDQNGDYIQKEKPIDKYIWFFYKPYSWRLYDDLHKNIKDEYKYHWIYKELFNIILDKKPELKKEVLKNDKFIILKSKLKKDDNKDNNISSTSFKQLPLQPKEST